MTLPRPNNNKLFPVYVTAPCKAAGFPSVYLPRTLLSISTVCQRNEVVPAPISYRTPHRSLDRASYKADATEDKTPIFLSVSVEGMTWMVTDGALRVKTGLRTSELPTSTP